MGGEAGGLHHPVKLLPGAAALLPEEEGLPDKGIRGQGGARGHRPVGGGQDGQVVLLVGLPLEGGGVGEALHQGQVQAVVQQGLLQGFGGGHGDLDLHLRPLGGEGPQGLGQEAGTDGQAGPHGQLAHLVPVAQLPVQVLEQAGDPLAIGLEPPALLGEHQPPAHPVKQGHAVVGLQLPDGGADGGLGQVELLGGLGGAAPAGAHRQKDVNVANGHGNAFPYMNFVMILIVYYDFTPGARGGIIPAEYHVGRDAPWQNLWKNPGTGRCSGPPFA